MVQKAISVITSSSSKTDYLANPVGTKWQIIILFGVSFLISMFVVMTYLSVKYDSIEQAMEEDEHRKGTESDDAYKMYAEPDAEINEEDKSGLLQKTEEKYYSPNNNVADHLELLLE